MSQELLDLATGKVIIPRLAVAKTRWETTVGLLGRLALPADEALLLPGCSCIHTAFMRFAIDAVFVDEGLMVRKVVSRLRPWRLAACLGAWGVIETAAGAATGAGLAPGRLLATRPAESRGTNGEGETA